MMKLLKKHQYWIMIHVALASVSVSIGLDDGVSDGLGFFGLASAIITVLAYLANEE